MATSPIIELKDNLLLDEDYISMCKRYEIKHTMDIGLLVKLLKRYEDLYVMFLKINVFVFGYETKGLNKELQDYVHYKGKNYYINDLETILRCYYSNYDRCRKILKVIVTCRLMPLDEINILKKILDRPVENEIKAFFDDKLRGTLNE